MLISAALSRNRKVDTSKAGTDTPARAHELAALIYANSLREWINASASKTLLMAVPTAHGAGFWWGAPHDFENLNFSH